MSKSGHGMYKKFLFETCAVHFKILCPLYGKAQGILQINQNKCNFPVVCGANHMGWPIKIGILPVSQGKHPLGRMTWG